MTTTTIDRSSPRLLPRPVTLLMTWHGLFVGAYTIAFVTSEGAGHLHEVAGYVTVALLALRFGIALVAPEKSLWALPWVSRAHWAAFGRKLLQNPAAAFRGRTPFAPLTGLLLLVSIALAATTGLLTLPSKIFEDLHEGAASLTYPAVFLHLAVVFLPIILRKLSKS